MSAFPSVALIMSVIIFRVVVFPAPFGPKKPTLLGPSIFRFNLDNAVNEPYVLVRLTASIEGFVKGRESPELGGNCNRNQSMHITISDAISCDDQTIS